MKVDHFVDHRHVFSESVPPPTRMKEQNFLREILGGEFPREFELVDTAPVTASHEREWEQVVPLIKRLATSATSSKELWYSVREILTSQGWYSYTYDSHYGHLRENHGLKKLMFKTLAEIDPFLGYYFVMEAYNGSREVIDRWNLDTKKEELLENFDSGDYVCCCFPTVEQEHAETSLTAVPTVDGQNFLINGMIENVEFAELGQAFLVWASAPKLEGRKLTLFYIPSDTPGISIVENQDFRSEPLNHFSHVTFQKVEVSKANIIGGVGKGYDQLKLLYSVRAQGRFLLSRHIYESVIESFEKAQHFSLDESLQYQAFKLRGRTRLQAANQLIQLKCNEDWIHLFFDMYYTQFFADEAMLMLSRFGLESLKDRSEHGDLRELANLLSSGYSRRYYLGLHVIREMFEDFLRVQHERDAFEFSRIETVFGSYKDRVISTLRKARARDLGPLYPNGVPHKAIQKKIRGLNRKFYQLLEGRAAHMKSDTPYYAVYSLQDLIEGLGLLTDMFVNIWTVSGHQQESQRLFDEISKEFDVWLKLASQFEPQMSVPLAENVVPKEEPVELQAP